MIVESLIVCLGAFMRSLVHIVVILIVSVYKWWEVIRAVSESLNQCAPPTGQSNLVAHHHVQATPHCECP